MRTPDYSNTIFYKIRCKDAAVTDLYVGHTTNFVQRKDQHERCCRNPSYDLKVYNVIRANGGWDNWHMEIVDFQNCADLHEAKRVEQEFYEKLNATMNSVQPSSKHKPKPRSPKVGASKYSCELCNFHSQNKTMFERHLGTNKHKTAVSAQKKAAKYCCDMCEFYSNHKTKFQNHLNTNKHKRNEAKQPSDKIQSEEKMTLIMTEDEFKSKVLTSVKEMLAGT